MDCHILGTACNNRGPNLAESFSKASLAPRRDNRAFAGSSPCLSPLSLPLLAAAEAEDGFVNDKTPSRIFLLYKKVGVCSTSWHRNVQRFLTILSGGWPRSR